jgi:hypothetical protein
MVDQSLPIILSDDTFASLPASLSVSDRDSERYFPAYDNADEMNAESRNHIVLYKS